MKRFLYLVGLISNFSYSQPGQQVPEADLLLSNLGSSLNKLRSANYRIDRYFNYESENYHDSSGGELYIEFLGSIPKESFRFQYTDKKYSAIYNGKHYFALNKEKKNMDLSIDPRTEELNSSSALYNSLYTLRNAIPKILEYKNSKRALFDTIINHKNYHAIRIELFHRYIGNTGELEEFTKEYTGDSCVPYLLIVDKERFLPYQFNRQFKGKGRENDFINVIYTDIKLNVPQPTESSWYYSTYISEFPIKKEKAPINNIGKKVSNTSLLRFNGNQQDSLSYKFPSKKPVLLEFWIKNCGYCMIAFPKMEQLQKRFGNDVEILAVNTEDKIDDIKFFFTKHQPSYKMLYNGVGLATELEIESFPTIVILDEKGIIIYSGSFDETRIEKELVKLINHSR